MVSVPKNVVRAVGVEQTGFAGLVVRNSGWFVLLALACASAWFFFERRRNAGRARLRAGRKRYNKPQK